MTVKFQPPPLPTSNQAIMPLGSANTGTSVTLGNSTMKAYPFWLPQTQRFRGIGAEVTIVGDVGSKFRLGIATDAGQMYPGNITDFGTIAGDSATVQEIAIDVTYGAGVLWLIGVVQNAGTTQPSMRTIATAAPGTYPLFVGLGTALPGVNVTALGYTQTGVAGALPAVFPGSAATTPTASFFARIFLRTF